MRRQLKNRIGLMMVIKIERIKALFQISWQPKEWEKEEVTRCFSNAFCREK